MKFFRILPSLKNKKFSRKFKEILDNSRNEVLRSGHDYVGAEHFLLGIIANKECLPMQVLKLFEINIEDLKCKIVDSIPKFSGNLSLLNLGQINLSSQAENFLRYSVLEAQNMKSEEVQPEHLMLSILSQEETNVTNLLNDFSIDYEKFKRIIDCLIQDSSAIP